MRIEFEVEFHGPFRVATGTAARGMDVAVDPKNPVPASSLKGVMRAAAGQLGLPEAIIATIYGGSGSASPWAWGDAKFVTSPQLRARARVAIEDGSGVAVHGALWFSEEFWAARATFEVEQTSFLPPADLQRHALVLRASARAVGAIGSDRRRGFGWVSCKASNGAIDDGEVARLLELRSGSPCSG